MISDNLDPKMSNNPQTFSKTNSRHRRKYNPENISFSASEIKIKKYSKGIWNAKLETVSDLVVCGNTFFHSFKVI